MTPRLSCAGAQRWKWVVCLICTGIMGCGDGDPAPPELSNLAPVTGAVKFKGEPIPGAIVIFHPDATGGAAKPPIASGIVESDGTFAVKSSISRFIEPGTAPGSYRLTVSWLEAAPTSLDSEAVKERLPKKYQNPQTSGLLATIEPGGKDLGEITLEAK